MRFARDRRRTTNMLLDEACRQLNYRCATRLRSESAILSMRLSSKHPPLIPDLLLRPSTVCRHSSLSTQRRFGADSLRRRRFGQSSGQTGRGGSRASRSRHRRRCRRTPNSLHLSIGQPVRDRQRLSALFRGGSHRGCFFRRGRRAGLRQTGQGRNFRRCR